MPVHQAIGYMFDSQTAPSEFVTADEEFEKSMSPLWERNFAHRMSIGLPNNEAQEMLLRAREMTTLRQFLQEAGCTPAETEGGYLDVVELVGQRFSCYYQVEGPIRVRGCRGS